MVLAISAALSLFGFGASATAFLHLMFQHKMLILGANDMGETGLFRSNASPS
jgi:hypothetical protein